MLSAIYANKQHNEEGFTLLELLIVVIVIGILAAIALPIFLNQQRAAVDASVQSDVRNTVAQIVGAQTTKETTVKATVSRTGTSIVVDDSTDGTKSSSATVASPTLSAVPASEDDYTVSGSNANGGKFQGASVDGGKVFTYTAKTGKFTTTSAVDPAASTTFDGTNEHLTTFENGGTSDSAVVVQAPLGQVNTTDLAHSGSHAVASSSGLNSGDIGLNAYLTNRISGKSYTVEGWYYVQATPGAVSNESININETVTNTATPYGETNHPVTAAASQFNKWIKFSYTGTAQAFPYANARVSINAHAGDARVLIDDVRVTTN